MEELNNKLLSKDQTVISSLISKLVENIAKNYEGRRVESAQFCFLQSKVVSMDSKVNEVAAEGILKLLKEGILDSNKLLEDFITLIPNNKISKGVVKIICGVLYYEFLKNGKNSPQKFNMYQPQHPFITILVNNSECFTHIYKELRFASKDPSWNMWNYSFYQYCFCNPINKKPKFHKMKLWINLLLSSQDDELIIKLINWLPLDPAGSLLVSAELLNELSHFSSRSKIDTEIILMLQVSALFKLVSKNHDPRDTISAIRLLLDQIEQINCIDPILLILVKAVTRALSTHSLDILQICELLINRPNVNYFVLQSIKVAILHWIGNPSSLSADVCSKADEIYINIDNLLRMKRTVESSNLRQIHERYHDIISTNQELCTAFEVMAVCESWKTKESILEFLKKVEVSGDQFIRKVIHVVFGLFICDLNDCDITLAAFKIICTYLENFKKFSHLVLTLTLYNLSNTSNPKVHFELFKYLTKLANMRENYRKVVTTIKVVHSSSDNALKTFGMRLMFDLWKTDKTAYPLLEEMLTEEEPTEHKWEYYVNKALIIKQICEINSKLYGEEMVAHLSRILNKCSEAEGELASSIAIDAISVLCSEGIIDIKTTWMTLAPKYLTDKRTKTVKSMCGLASAISSLMHPEHHKDLQKEVICTIWDYAVNNADIEVKKAALNSLAEFGLENISPHFPEQYLNEDSASKSDIVPQLVPGICWINFLKDQTDLSVVGDFLIKMIKREVDEYPKYVYHIASKKEPIDYSLLPSHSLVRGVVMYCTTQMNKWNGLYKHVFIECMRILSQEYSKPLPPYNWAFLHQLFNEPELKSYCITIASHQVMISGTARRFVENYIETLIGDYEDLEGALLIYGNLKFLANSIQPTIFERFFNSTLNYAQHLKTDKKNEEFIISLIDALKDVLANPAVQDISKKVIVSYIDATLESFNESDEIFDIFLNCVPCYPPDLLKNVTALPIPEKMTDELYQKAVKIRCKLALNTKEKLKWLDDLVDRDRVNTKCNYPLEEFLKIFIQQKNLGECIQWTIDLIGRIEVAVADNSAQSYIIFLMEVLVIVIVAFSGFHIFTCSHLDINQYLKLLPPAADILLEMKEWAHDSSKVLECFYYLSSNKGGSIPENFQTAFRQTLQALRHHVEFKREHKWMKYLNADINLRTIQ
ncbi:focadhesin [Coccinella septempunctata]|uniref:focadhesin n=1 Tax=Coccinella septempunctata TaxID=41139 RepID=UPI001D0632C3|nr:focadhesin [Coccinella septempunctata]XP_044747228.1 focadhesin [Coccinella septempunctata]